MTCILLYLNVPMHKKYLWFSIACQLCHKDYLDNFRCGYFKGILKLSHNHNCQHSRVFANETIVLPFYPKAMANL